MRLKFAWLAALCLALGPLAAVAAGGDGGPDENEQRTVYQIEIEDAAGRHSSIDRVILVGDDVTRVAKARLGIARGNQNRLDYSSIPLIGKLSEHRYDKEDFVDANRVGVVRIDGHDLIMALAPGAALKAGGIAKLAVLNKTFAFETRAPLGRLEASGREAWDARGREIGALYRQGDDRLLGLIRPFIVTDAGLW